MMMKNKRYGEKMNNEKNTIWTTLAFLLMIPCGALRLGSLAARQNSRQETSYENIIKKYPTDIDREALSRAALGPPPDRVDCNSEKYKDLCNEKMIIESEHNILSLKDSEKCLGSALAYQRSAEEYKKQDLYFQNKNKYFESKIEAGQKGLLSIDELESLTKKAEAFEKQIHWINKVTDKLKKLHKEIENCKDSAFHPDLTDSGVERVAVEEYNKIWK
jgi:hypothetical protein